MVKRQSAPTTAECRDAPIGILKSEKPLNAGERGRLRDCIIGRELAQGENSTSRVISIRHTTSQIGPRPAPRSCMRIWMFFQMLLFQQPFQNDRSADSLPAKRVYR